MNVLDVLSDSNKTFAEQASAFKIMSESLDENSAARKALIELYPDLASITS